MSSLADNVLGDGTAGVNNKGTILVLTILFLLLIYADNAGVLAKIVTLVKSAPSQYTKGITAPTDTATGTAATSPTTGAAGGTTVISIGGVPVTVPTAPALPPLTPGTDGTVIVPITGGS